MFLVFFGIPTLLFGYPSVKIREGHIEVACNVVGNSLLEKSLVKADKLHAASVSVVIMLIAYGPENDGRVNVIVNNTRVRVSVAVVRHLKNIGF